MLTMAQLTAVFQSCPEATYQAYLPYLNAAMYEFGITRRPIRMAHFLGQLGHESAGLLHMEEIADGSAYEGRLDLGNTQPGDGMRYKGRGPIQISGRDSYRTAGAALGVGLEADPERASDPDVAFRIAGWYWRTRAINKAADQGDTGFQRICELVNGGPPNHVPERWAYYEKAKAVLGISGTEPVRRASFAKIKLAAGNYYDGEVAALMHLVLTRRHVKADVVREWAIPEAHADCVTRAVGTDEFAVIGKPALDALLASDPEAAKHVLPDTPENRKNSDHRSLVGAGYEETAKRLAPAFLDRISPGAGKEYLEAGGASLTLELPAPQAATPARLPAKPQARPPAKPQARPPAKPQARPQARPSARPPARPRPDNIRELVEKAIAFGMRLRGAPYGNGWREGTWPDGPSLYARCDPRVHTTVYVRGHELVCSAFINVVRAHVARLPAIGRAQRDPYPGGTAAISRTLARMRGCRPYPPVENTPRGWLVFSPYLGPQLYLQGHVGIALGDGRVLEARVPHVSDNRTENEGHMALISGGGQGYTTIIPPEMWLRV